MKSMADIMSAIAEKKGRKLCTVETEEIKESE